MRCISLSTHLEFALIKGTHWCLESRMAEVHKHHIPGLLLRSREILFVDPICQCNYMEDCSITNKLNNYCNQCESVHVITNGSLGGSHRQYNNHKHAHPCPSPAPKTLCTDLQLSHSWASDSWDQRSEQHRPLISSQHQCSSKEPVNTEEHLKWINFCTLTHIFLINLLD